MTTFRGILPVLFYGLVLAVLVFALKWMQWKFLIVDQSLEIYLGLVAGFFTILGIWIATRLAKPKIETVVLEKEVLVDPGCDFLVNKRALQEINLSNREYEVLKLLVKGNRNAEIAEELFISVSTVKTHVSSLLEKMDAKSRTHAAEKARQMRIV